MPTTRRRALILMVREDVYEKWGWPEGRTEKPQRRHLQEILRDPSDVSHLFLPETEVTWDTEALRSDELHVVVGHIGEKEGWGTRVYKNCVPATKASRCSFVELICKPGSELEQRPQWFCSQ